MRTKRTVKTELNAARKQREQLWAEYNRTGKEETRQLALDAAWACDRLNVELDNLA